MKFNSIYESYYNYLSLKLKPTTLLGVDRKIKKHFLSKFGDYNINDLTLENYVNWCINLKEYNYSESFYKNIQAIMKDFFNYLYINYDFNNYANKIVIYGGKNDKKILNTWNIKEFKKFIKYVDNPVYHALFNTLYFTGIRKGEALALRFSDIDNNYLNINKSITKEFFNGKRLELTPKSKKSIRKIRIDLKMKMELKQLRKYYNTLYNNFNNNFYIFGGIKPLSTTTIDRYKLKYEKKANIKHIRIHDLRHSHATLLYNHNIDIKLIQERLGHANISTTLDIYVHSDKNKEKRLIHAINLLRL